MVKMGPDPSTGHIKNLHALFSKSIDLYVMLNASKSQKLGTNKQGNKWRNKTRQQ